MTCHPAVSNPPLQTEWRETCCSLLPPFSSSPVLSEFIALELVEQVKKGISNMQSFEEGQQCRVVM